MSTIFFHICLFRHIVHIALNHLNFYVRLIYISSFIICFDSLTQEILKCKMIKTVC